MFPLDPKTVERLAKVVVDVDGPYERAGYELARLLRRAGWSDPEDHDGSGRVRWLIDQLEAREHDQSAIERFLCRICDPLEYDDGRASADVFRDLVNDILAHERLVVTQVAGRPVVSELGVDGSTPMYSEPAELERRLRSLIKDGGTVEGLLRRAAETRICEAGGAHTFAIIGIGSLVEGMLLAILLERDEDLRANGFPDSKKPDRRVRPQFASLGLLIDTAYQKDWIQLDATSFMHTVRDFRNFVHPRKELAEQPDFDADSVMLCWAPVQALLNDLEARLEPVA